MELIAGLFLGRVSLTVELPVGDGCDTDTALEQRGRAGHCQGCRIAAVTPAPDADAPFVHKVQTVAQIFGDLQLVGHFDRTEPAVHLVQQLVPLAAAAPAVDLRHDVVFRTGQVGVPVDAPLVRHQLGAGTGVAVEMWDFLKNKLRNSMNKSTHTCTIIGYRVISSSRSPGGKNSRTWAWYPPEIITGKDLTCGSATLDIRSASAVLFCR